MESEKKYRNFKPSKKVVELLEENDEVEIMSNLSVNEYNVEGLGELQTVKLFYETTKDSDWKDQVVLTIYLTFRDEPWILDDKIKSKVADFVRFSLSCLDIVEVKDIEAISISKTPFVGVITVNV